MSNGLILDVLLHDEEACMWCEDDAEDDVVVVLHDEQEVDVVDDVEDH